MRKNEENGKNGNGPALSKYQRFTIERISRRQLKEAAYNPRIIDDHAKKLLNKSLKKTGLVETIVWNKRTGNVVGGHQRLGQLDALEKNQDYLLDVAVIDVDEKEEREINIKLNNPKMQGAYDADKLGKLFIEDGVNFSDTGFSALDIQLSFDTPTANAILGQEREELPEVEEDIEKIKDIKARRKRDREKGINKNTSEFFRVVVFNDFDGMQRFLQFFGFDPNINYVDGEMLMDFLDSLSKVPSSEDSEDKKIPQT